MISLLGDRNIRSVLLGQSLSLPQTQDGCPNLDSASILIRISAKPFCQGEPGAMGLSRMPMVRNRCVTAAP
jgi:hypothetical protein